MPRTASAARRRVQNLGGSMRGATGYAVTVPDNNLLDLTVGTIFFWAQSQRVTTTPQAVVSKRVDGNVQTNYSCFVNADGTLASWNGTSYVATTNRVDVLVPHRYAFRYNVGTLDVFCDGVLVQQLAHGMGAANAGGLHFGVAYPTTSMNGFNGWYDDVMICSSNESNAAILAEYAEGTTPASFVERWSFSEQTGTTTVGTPNGLTGTLVTVAAWSTFTFGALCIAVATPHRAVGEVFILNGDFTTIPTLVAPQTTTGYIDGTATGSAVPIAGSNWAVFGINNSITAEIDATETYNGKATLKLATTDVNSRVTAANILSATRAGMLQAIPVLPSTAYTVTFAMKTNVTSGDSNDGAVVSIVERNSEGTQVIVNAITAVKVTQDWTVYTVPFTTAATTCFITLRPAVTGNTGAATLIMTAWFGDFHAYSTALLRTAAS